MEITGLPAIVTADALRVDGEFVHVEITDEAAVSAANAQAEAINDMACIIVDRAQIDVIREIWR